MSTPDQVEDLHIMEMRLRRSKPLTEPLPQQFKRDLFNHLMQEAGREPQFAPRRLAHRLAVVGFAVLLLLFVVGISPAGSVIAEFILRFGPFALTGDPSAAEQSITSTPINVVTPEVISADLSEAAQITSLPIYYPRYWPEGYAIDAPPLIDLVYDAQGEVTSLQTMRFSRDGGHILHFSQTPVSPDAAQDPLDLPIGDADAQTVNIGLHEGLWLENYVAGIASGQESVPYHVLIWQETTADGQTFLYWLGSEERLPLDVLVQTADSLVSVEEGPARHLNVDFSDALTLLGFELTGMRGELRLFWQLKEALQEDFMIFVHWQDEAGLPVQQIDLPLPDSQWLAGQNAVQIIDLSEVNLGAGVYTISIGLYDAASKERVTVEGFSQGLIPLAEMEMDEIDAVLPLIAEEQESFTLAAMDTVTAFNQSGEGSSAAGPFIDIPSSLWADEISQLHPLRVYWHLNNLAIVLVEDEDVQRGLYIGVPISSYMLQSDDFSQIEALGPGLWKFEMRR